jgi:hypothetical protein
MSNKILTINGYMVNGKFQPLNPEVTVTKKYEFRGVLYDTLEEAETAKNTLQNTITIATIMRKLNGGYIPEPRNLANRIMTTPDGLVLYEALKAYFEPEKS